MRTLLSSARACAPAAALLLAACNAPSGSALIAARAAAMDPPQLWLVEALDAAGQRAGAVQVCTDSALRAGFTRANAEVNGETCAPHRDPVEKPGLYAVRCDLNGHPYGLTLNRLGASDDYQVRFTLTALDGVKAAAAQTRHYRRLGACPAGWRVGDQARLGAARGENALSGQWAGR